MKEKPLLRAEHVSKDYGAGRVLDDVSIELISGKILGLAGQNGSGKSTLIKILAGYTSPEPGATCWLAGEATRLGTRDRRQSELLHFVHQNDRLIEGLSVADNIALGVGYAGRFGTISGRAHRDRCLETLRILGADIEPKRPAATLSAVERVVVAIARALQSWVTAESVLVLDEPTAALPAREVFQLFAVLTRLAETGAAILFVSHHADEVLDFTHEVAVLRNGTEVGRWPTQTLTEESLFEAITGRVGIASAAAPHSTSRERSLCHVRDLSGAVVKGATFDIHEGEILGLAGLDGSGREEILGLLFGSQLRAEGRVESGSGAEVRAIAEAKATGIAFVPADRMEKGLIGDWSIVDNASLSSLGQFCGPMGVVNRRQEREVTAAMMETVEVTPLQVDAPVKTLSGGNQQKVLVGKALLEHPSILLLDEPVQGVDVGARASLFELLRRLAREEELAIVVASSVNRDLAAVCDRILVLCEGRVTSVVQGDIDPDVLDALVEGRAGTEAATPWPA